MTKKSNQHQKKRQYQTPPPAATISNDKGDKKVNGEGDREATPKETNVALNLPQPFIVKEEKENKGWLKRLKTSEVISMIALGVSVFAVLLNIRSLDNTSKSLAISDSTFKRTINQFEAEGRPIIQIGDIKIENLLPGVIPKITFKYANLGKLPATLLMTGGRAYFDVPEKEEEIKKKPDDSMIVSNTVLSTQTVTSSGVNFTEAFTEGSINGYKAGKAFFYLKMKYTYETFATHKPYGAFYIFKIGYSPVHEKTIEAIVNVDY